MMLYLNVLEYVYVDDVVSNVLDYVYVDDVVSKCT
jgi:hypothetical protein